MMSLLDEPALLDDRFATEEDRDRERRTVNALIEARLRAKPHGHCFHEVQRLAHAPLRRRGGQQRCRS